MMGRKNSLYVVLIIFLIKFNEVCTKNREFTNKSVKNTNDAVFSNLNKKQYPPETDLKDEGTHFIVETKYGKIRGYNLHEPLKIRSFIDIPYGKFEDLFKVCSFNPIFSFDILQVANTF